MKVLNFGSLNIDRVYNVTHHVLPGETITAADLNTYAGGKGLNQSIPPLPAIPSAGTFSPAGVKACLSPIRSALPLPPLPSPFPAPGQHRLFPHGTRRLLFSQRYEYERFPNHPASAFPLTPLFF